MICPDCKGTPIVYGIFPTERSWRGGTAKWNNSVALANCIRCRGLGTVGNQPPADHLF